MTSKDLFEIVGQTKPEHRQQAVEALFADELQNMEGTQNMNRKTVWSAGRIVLAAAIAALLLATAAFAADLFGVQALLTGDEIITPSGEEEQWLSLSQPQAVPEELDPAIAEKVAKSKEAWAEWSAYLEDSRFVPDLYKKLEQIAPEGTDGISITVTSSDMPELTEGKVSWRDFFALLLEKYGTGVNVAIFFDEKGEPLGDVAISEEDMALHIQQLDEHMNDPAWTDDLYGSYGVSSKEEADKLEEIAAKYGLALRKEREVVWPGVTGTSAYDDLTEIMLQAGCRGNIFTELPTVFDKIAWYDEGTFLISFDVMPPSGNKVMCKGYNAMYATLSSGNELQDTVADPEGLTTRSYTAADGTELTILENNREAYLYVYLEDSFFTEAIGVADNAPDLTREDINYVADFLSYSLIGN